MYVRYRLSTYVNTEPSEDQKNKFEHLYVRTGRYGTNRKIGIGTMRTESSLEDDIFTMLHFHTVNKVVLS